LPLWTKSNALQLVISHEIDKPIKKVLVFEKWREKAAKIEPIKKWCSPADLLRNTP
jgi:hypothetical protein